jgi:two-component system response regulator YesN
MVGVSKNYLTSFFKQELGINFSNYINMLRLEKSKELLINTDKKVYEIAEEVGFDNAYYFCKVFKESEKITCKKNIYFTGFSIA